MVGSGLAGLTSDFASDSLTPLFRILPIAAAVAATIIPILFMGSRDAAPGGNERRRNRSWPGLILHRNGFPVRSDPAPALQRPLCR
jgi:hypothetical protein